MKRNMFLHSFNCSAGTPTLEGQHQGQEGRTAAFVVPTCLAPFAKIAISFLQMKSGKKGPLLMPEGAHWVSLWRRAMQDRQKVGRRRKMLS